MATNKQLLKSYIVRFDNTQDVLAAAMGISLSGLSAKINDAVGREFSQSEIAFIKHRYSLTGQDVDNIFFSQQVSKTDTNALDEQCEVSQ